MKSKLEKENIPARQALESNDIQRVKSLFSRTNVNVHFRDAESPLHIAACRCSPSVVEFLLSLGADPNSPGWDGVTPLHRAALSKHPEIILLLKDAGANFSVVRSSTKETPKELVKRKGHTEVQAVFEEIANK